jgi:hypothetical protein
MGLAASVLPWEDGKSFKVDMASINDRALFMALCRDKNSSGKVVIDGDGTPRVHYTLDQHDSESLIDAVEKMLRIAAAAGATELRTLQQGVPTCMLEVDDEEENSEEQKQQRLDEYLVKVRQAGVQSNRCGLFSAHQMGTCKMGTNKATSVLCAYAMSTAECVLSSNLNEFEFVPYVFTFVYTFLLNCRWLTPTANHGTSRICLLPTRPLSPPHLVPTRW